MSRIQDRKRLRRDYLRQKGNAYLRVTFSTLAFLSIVVLWLGLGWFLPYPTAPGVRLLAKHVSVLLLIFACMAYVCMRQQVQQAKRIPYVPPVIPDTLPAEEVLVRGSEEPVQAQREVLVRPAIGEEEMPQEQLLRPTTGELQG